MTGQSIIHGGSDSATGKVQPALEDVLSIFLITYNRAAELQRTLRALRASPWANCRITVLDNCSTDHTPQVAGEEGQGLTNFTYVRNVTNIGPGANTVQCFLLSGAPYTWVVCDDDDLDFGQVDDIADVLCGHTAGLVLVGGHFEAERRGMGRMGTPTELMNLGVNYYRDNSFLPSTIYSTDFARKHLRACYDFCHFSYPQVALGLAAVREALPTYVSRHRLVTPTLGTQSYTRREQMLWWYGIASTVSEIPERKRLMISQWQGPLDPTGLYGTLNTAARLRLYGVLFRLLVLFKGEVLSSIVRMVRARARRSWGLT